MGRFCKVRKFKAEKKGANMLNLEAMGIGTFGEKLAYWLSQEFISKADVFIDLHGGDMIEALTSFTIYPSGHAASYELAKAFGIDLLVASESDTTNLSSASRSNVNVSDPLFGIGS
jgi:hypothetical protein